jgi:ArsR family transcriptional regulator
MASAKKITLWHSIIRGSARRIGLISLGYLAILPNNDEDTARMTFDSVTKARFAAKARIIKAMAHPTRLFIVDELSRQSRCVCELTDMIGADVSTVSKHLAILRSAGIVADDKRGVQVWYTLKMPCILNFFGCVEQVQKRTAKEQLATLSRK